MATRSRRAFRPTIDGVRLEDRTALSGPTAAAAVATTTTTTTTATTTDPLNTPTNVTLKGRNVTAEFNQLHSAYVAFIRRVQRACDNAATNLSNGQNPDNLLAGLKTYVGIQAGNLQVQLDRISRTLPGGEQYLFNPPQGPLPAGTTYPDPTGTDCGPDVRYFVPPDLRLKTQLQTIVTTINAATTLQQACSPDTVPAILKVYQNSRAAMTRYVHCAVQMNVFSVPGWS